MFNSNYNLSEKIIAILPKNLHRASRTLLDLKEKISASQGVRTEGCAINRAPLRFSPV